MRDQDFHTRIASFCTQQYLSGEKQLGALGVVKDYVWSARNTAVSQSNLKSLSKGIAITPLPNSGFSANKIVFLEIGQFPILNLGTSPNF